MEDNIVVDDFVFMIMELYRDREGKGKKKVIFNDIELRVIQKKFNFLIDR